jgi:pilus assembly protein CpaC
MSSISKHGVAFRLGAWALAMCAAVTFVAAAAAAPNKALRIPVGRAEVLTADDEVRTVAIAEPKIADATTGSERTVVVSAKAPGRTTLIVYTAAGRWQGYDIEVYVPNAERQVALHVKIAEVTDNASRELGFDWWGRGTDASIDGSIVGGLFPTKVVGPSSPLLVGPLTDGFVGYRRADGNLELQTVWRALEEKGEIRVLANPTLVARSGKEAKFLAGGEFPVPISSGGGTSGPDGSRTITITVEWKEFGVKVNFKPTVEEDGSITLDVEPEVSQLDFTTNIQLNGFNIPSVVTRRTSTSVNLKRGEYLAIGGLKQTEKVRRVRRIPILGQIPLLGFFFSNTETENVTRDLLVVVTPDLIEAVASEPALPTDRPVED